MSSYDVIIIGAGPAGSTAGRFLAESGFRTLLIDKKKFPRHKTCASWINRLAFEQFPYLQPQLDRLIETPFFGMTFLDANLEKQATFLEKVPSGYLTLRSKFDYGLKQLAEAGGCKSIEGFSLTQLNDGSQTGPGGKASVSVELEDGRSFSCKVLIGADGAHSKVARLGGFRQSWGKDQYVMCANEDVPSETDVISSCFPRQSPIYVVLRYANIEGYGWVFPKREHICVGIGGRLKDDHDIRPLYRQFFEHLKDKRLLPQTLQSKKVDFGIDPAGGVNRSETLVKGRILLVGDAAGFVSGSTGEGIYPAMVSARCAAEVIREAFKKNFVEGSLQVYNERWREVLGDYLGYLPGGQRRGNTMKKLDYIFKSQLICRMAARAFLYGEGTGVRDLLRNLWKR